MALRKAGALAAVGTAAALADEDTRDFLHDVGAGGVRFSRALYYAGIVSFDYKTTLRFVEPGTEAYDKAKSAMHLRSAKRLLHVCSMHGGVYTKFGQHIASMNHILPREYTETLRVLQDRNPSVGMAEVEKAVRAELGGAITELFAEFDEKAIAAASLAQVHRAVTKTGQEVAVKLQYPGLEDRVQRDVLAMRLLADMLGWLFPEYGYSWMFPEFEETVQLELDFVQEAVNSERVARMFSGRKDVYIPPVCWQLTTRRLLTMEFVRGAKITDVEEIKRQNMDPVQVARSVASAFGDMIYVHGFVHCDPHPGNLMVRQRTANNSNNNYTTAAGRNKAANLGKEIAKANGGERSDSKNSTWSSWLGWMVRPWRWVPHATVPHQVILLDHGMYRRLDPKFRHDYCRLWKAFMTRDANLGRKTAKELGLGEDMYDALSLVLTWRPADTTARVGARISEEERQALAARYRGTLSPEFINVFLEALPRDMLFVMRTGDLVRSLNKELGGTSRQRLIILGESALHGLALPNDGAAKTTAVAGDLSAKRLENAENLSFGRGRRVSAPENEEAKFRRTLREGGVKGPDPLELSCPEASVNLLVPSELGASKSPLLPWDILEMRVRVWLYDLAFGAVWWWQGRRSFTTRDIG